MNLDSLLSFGNSGFLRDDNDTLDQVFAQILQQEERSASQPVYNCQCVKEASAYSSVLELVPHLRRALDALSSIPEHQAQLAGFDTCYYLSQLKSLNEAIS